MKLKYLIIFLLFSSCSLSKRATNKISWLKSRGFIKEQSDTIWQTLIIPADTVKIEIGARLDTLYIDSVLETINDTCIGKKRVKELARSIPCKVEPINYEDSLVKITNIHGFLEVIHKKMDVKVPQIINKTEVRCPETKTPFWIILLMVAMGVVIFALAIKGK